MPKTLQCIKNTLKVQRIDFHFEISQSDAKAVNATNNTTKITDMPLELLLDIYEDLDVNSLTNVAKTHPYNWNAAAIIYRSTFAIEAFDIHGEYVFQDTFSWILDRENKSKEFESMLSSLQMFGHLITKLKLNYRHFTDEQQDRVNQYLNDYITDSLVEIELSHFTASDLSHIAAKLKSVKTAKLSNGNVTSHVNLSEIFAAVRTLDITFMHQVPESCFEYNFPNLEEIMMELSVETASQAFERRVRLNPQLRVIELWNCEWQGLRVMSELLPNLEKVNAFTLKLFI